VLHHNINIIFRFFEIIAFDDILIIYLRNELLFLSHILKSTYFYNFTLLII